MGLLIGICAFIFSVPGTEYKKTTQDESLKQYYVYAYYFGGENTLLITDIKSFEFPTDNKVGLKTQLFLFSKSNNARIKIFLQTRFPQQVPFISESIENLVFSEDFDFASEEREFKINQNEDNVILVTEFEFLPPQIQTTGKKEKFH